MRRLTHGLVAVLAAVPLAAVAVVSVPTTANAQDNGVGLTPPLGWSSWSAIRHNPTAATIEAQADAMKNSGLAAAGFQYVNLDDFYYICPGSQGPDVDAYGRWVTDPVKFPPSGTTDGINVVADYVHRDGLKFGLYVTPGISKQAVAKNTPIEGTPYHAADIATTAAENNYNCKGMVGVDYGKPGAQEFVNSWANLFASWGVDYVKIDGVGTFDVPDIQAWSAALRQTGRPIHLELSNNLNISAATTWKQYANGWRTSGDIECYSCESDGSSYPLTSWPSVQGRFNQVANWRPHGGPGGFNDYDSLELGNGGGDGLTPDERKTQMSLWALGSSPLILGTDLTRLDPYDLTLLRNRDVLAVDQDAIDAARIVNTSDQQVFAKTEPNGDVIVGLFNTAGNTGVVSVAASAVGLPAASAYLVNDLWSHRFGAVGGTLAAVVPSHGVALWRVRPTRLPFLVPPVTTLAVTGLLTLTAGQPATVTASFTNNGVQPVRAARLALSRPAGWRVTPTSATTFPFVAAGQTVQATFEVVEPVSTRLFESATLTATGDYRWDTFFPSRVSSPQVVTSSPPVTAPYRTFASTPAAFGELGSRIGIRADGKDVYGNSNQYGTVYLPGGGHDGTTATVEVTAQGNTHTAAKAGIIMRNDVTNVNASPGYVIVAVTPGHGYVMQWDANGDGQLDAGAAPNGQGTGTTAYPSWLRLVRTGNSYAGSYSTDGTTWILLGTVTLPTATVNQDVGVFATSHHMGTQSEVHFDQFSVSP
jgi:hypothetical protein